MTRRIPVFATVIVAAAVATMIGLGIWQLQRRAEKAQLISSYEAAAADPAPVGWGEAGEDGKPLLYRRTRLVCASTSEITLVSGRSADGQNGLAAVAQCLTQAGDPARVVLGFTIEPKAPQWAGGAVTGIVAPGPRVVADPPLAGLQANARPDPSDIPDNHLAYAIQWFFFAAAAALIYWLALRKRLAAGDAGG